VLLVTSEYRYGTIRPTILFTPHRSRVLAAKLIAGLLAGLGFGVVGEGSAGRSATRSSRARHLVRHERRRRRCCSGSAGSPGSPSGGSDRRGPRRDRPQPGRRCDHLLAWGFIVDNLLFGLVPSIGRFTPTRAQDA
jgi:hypothetical protein